MSSLDIEQISQYQQGLITAQQLLALGYSRDRIKSHLRSERLQRVHTGVYRVAGTPFDWQTAIQAAVLASPAGAVASHQSSLALHGLIQGHESLSIHTSVEHRRSGAKRSFTIHRTFLPSSHITVVNGIKTTCIARALLDTAKDLPRRQLEKFVDEALATQQSTTNELAQVMADIGTKGFAGAANYRKVVESRLPLAPGSQSILEMRFLKLVHKAGLPQPQTQYPVRMNGRRYLVDACWPDRKLAVELDGYGVHGTSRKRFDDDRARNNCLLLAGLKVLHFTARMPDNEILSALTPHFSNLE